MIVYLDLDGVFADFKSYFNQKIGFEYESNPGKAWDILSKEEHLFLNLKPLPGAIEMFDTITRHFNNVKILTALPRLKGNLNTAAADKTAWVHKHLTKHIEVICTDSWRGKKQYAKPGDVLIDDMERNINDWRGAGGIGILHKNPNNTRFHLAGLIDQVM